MQIADEMMLLLEEDSIAFLWFAYGRGRRERMMLVVVVVVVVIAARRSLALATLALLFFFKEEAVGCWTASLPNCLDRCSYHDDHPQQHCDDDDDDARLLGLYDATNATTTRCDDDDVACVHCAFVVVAVDSTNHSHRLRDHELDWDASSVVMTWMLLLLLLSLLQQAVSSQQRHDCSSS